MRMPGCARQEFATIEPTAARGQPGASDMQTLFAHPALWRGLLLFAGMLWGKSARSANATPRGAVELVSWRPGARSRREDELERRRDEVRP